MLTKLSRKKYHLFYPVKAFKSMFKIQYNLSFHFKLLSILTNEVSWRLWNFPRCHCGAVVIDADIRILLKMIFLLLHTMFFKSIYPAVSFFSNYIEPLSASTDKDSVHKYAIMTTL